MESYDRWPSDPVLQRQLYSRMERIAACWRSVDKSLKCRVLRCSGFCHHGLKESPGFILEYPPSIKSSSFTVLHSILHGDPEIQGLPLLGDRVKLGYEIAAAIYEIHTMGWLHKTISASSIAIFYDKNGKPAESIRRPYVIGLSSGREDGSSGFT